MADEDLIERTGSGQPADGVAPKQPQRYTREAERRAAAEVQAIENELVAARARVVAANVVVKQKRAALAMAIKNFQAEYPIVTPDQALHNYARGEFVRRMAIAKGLVSPYVPVSSVGPSPFDRARKAGYQVGTKPVHDIPGVGPRVVKSFPQSHRQRRVPMG